MIIDNQLLLWDDNTTWTAGVSDAIPLRETGKFRSEEAGEPMEIVIACSVAFTGTFNIDINLVTATDANLTTNQVVQKILLDGITALAVGKNRFALSFPVADADATHYGLEVVVNSGSVSAGTASAWIQRAGEDQFTIND